MIYENTVPASFIRRVNRFVAIVSLEGREEVVHVKNTGRCRELLLTGAKVILQRSGNPARKTRYDLISVYKPGLGWVNIDSQAPNVLMQEWLESGTSVFGKISYLKPEYTYGNSRIDFYLETAEDPEDSFALGKGGSTSAEMDPDDFSAPEAADKSVAGEAIESPSVPEAADKPSCLKGLHMTSDIDLQVQRQCSVLIEVKGCTLEIDGADYFPDAPTERGIRHLKELIKARKEGYLCYIAFVSPMPGVTVVYPNRKTHPQFGDTLKEAFDQGVGILYLACDVEPDRVQIVSCHRSKA